MRIGSAAATAVAAVALSATLSACGIRAGSGSGGDADRARDACLYAAVRAYPAWTASKVPVLDGVPQCKDLSPDQKAELRKIMAEFVAAANASARKKGS